DAARVRRELDLGALLLPALPDAAGHRRARLCLAGVAAPPLARRAGGDGARPRLDPFRMARHRRPYHGSSRVSLGPGATPTVATRVPCRPSGFRRQTRPHAADLRGPLETGGRNGP